MLTALDGDVLCLPATRILRSARNLIMPNNSPDLQKKLRQLQQQYATKLPEKIAALERNWQMVNQHPADNALYQNLIRDFHTLAGSGGSYGFHAVTTLCREIEETLRSNQPPLPPALKREIENKLAALKQADGSR
jgi:HPt (histidine-containing phosphotransfer) domain-containing protein